MDLNRVELLGRCGGDPQMGSGAGKKVARFSVATGWKSGDVEHTTWHRCVAFERQAELAEKMLFQGCRVYIDGPIQTRKYTGKDGVERETFEIVVRQFIVLGGKPKPGSGEPQADTVDDNVPPF